jgi:hypothetical protein
MKLFWWRKPKEEPKPVPRPDPKTVVYVFFKHHSSMFNSYRELWYDKEEPADVFPVTDGAWLTWPTDREGEILRVSQDNVTHFVTKPYQKRQIC